MSEHVEHVIADGPAAPMTDPADQIAVIEAQADATAEIIAAQADAEVQVIEARADAAEGSEEWRSQIDSLRVSQEDARREQQTSLEMLRTEITAALTILADRMDHLTPPPPPPEEARANPDPDPSEATSGGSGSEPPEASEEAEAIVKEPAKEPERPERKRAHRWI